MLSDVFIYQDSLVPYSLFRRLPHDTLLKSKRQTKPSRKQSALKENYRNPIYRNDDVESWKHATAKALVNL